MLEANDAYIKQGQFVLTANWALKEPGIYALLGPSGAGKSTFLSAIGGFVSLHSGGLRFEGKDISHLTPSQRPISNVFQSQNLFPRMTIFENIQLAKPKARQSEVLEIAERFQIADHLHKRPHEVSGGQGVRAALARAALQDQRLWLLDEPFASLGPKLDRELRKLIAHEFVRESARTVIFVSHQPSLIENWADYVLWVDDGCVENPVQATDFMNKKPFSAQSYL